MHTRHSVYDTRSTMEMDMDTPLTIDCLTPGMLDNIFSQLPSKQRARCALVSKHWRDVIQDSPTLWRSMEHTLSCRRHMLHFSRWLSCRPTGAITTLTLHLNAKPKHSFQRYREALQSTSGPFIDQVMPLFRIFLAPSLLHLELTACGEDTITVDSWAAGLSHLKSLVLCGDAVVVENHLGGAQSLESLEIRGRDARSRKAFWITFKGPGCFPASLKNLYLNGGLASPLPEGISRAKGLTKVVLSVGRTTGGVWADDLSNDLGALWSVSSLKHLALIKCRFSYGRLPAGIAQLTGLTTLDLTGTQFNPDCATDGDRFVPQFISLSPLTSLLALQNLSLKGCDIGPLDETSLAALPNLRQLWLSDNTQIKMPYLNRGNWQVMDPARGIVVLGRGSLEGETFKNQRQGNNARQRFSLDNTSHDSDSDIEGEVGEGVINRRLSLVNSILDGPSSVSNDPAQPNTSQHHHRHRSVDTNTETSATSEFRSPVKKKAKPAAFVPNALPSLQALEIDVQVLANNVNILAALPRLKVLNIYLTFTALHVGVQDGRILDALSDVILTPKLRLVRFYKGAIDTFFLKEEGVARMWNLARKRPDLKIEFDVVNGSGSDFSIEGRELISMMPATL